MILCFELTIRRIENLRFTIWDIKMEEESDTCRIAFTENGVAMLSSILNSRRAIHGQYPNHADFYKAEGDLGFQ